MLRSRVLWGHPPRGDASHPCIAASPLRICLCSSCFLRRCVASRRSADKSSDAPSVSVALEGAGVYCRTARADASSAGEADRVREEEMVKTSSLLLVLLAFGAGFLFGFSWHHIIVLIITLTR